MTARQVTKMRAGKLTPSTKGISQVRVRKEYEHGRPAARPRRRSLHQQLAGTEDFWSAVQETSCQSSSSMTQGCYHRE